MLGIIVEGAYKITAYKIPWIILGLRQLFPIFFFSHEPFSNNHQAFGPLYLYDQP